MRTYEWPEVIGEMISNVLKYRGLVEHRKAMAREFARRRRELRRLKAQLKDF